MNGVVECSQRAASLVTKLVNELKKLSSHAPQSENSLESHRVEDPRVIHTILSSRLGPELDSLIHDVEVAVPTKLTCWHVQPCIVKDQSWIESGWANVIHTIIIPLLNILGRCYACLDETEVASPEVAATGGKHRPSAPPGMLSIQHYVDIGVLLEMTVVLSILPFLDDHILPSIEHRLRAIPRTIVGRTPLRALRNGFASLKSSSLQQSRLFALSIGVSSVGNVIQLDRFRPMLLPRHLSDLYAGILQSQQLLKKIKRRNVANVLWGFPFAGLQRVNDLLQSDQESPTVATHHARAFQNLLLHGRDSPQWLKERLSILLDRLATSRLDVVIQVFVLEATKDRTSSAARLTNTLLAQRNEPRSTEYYSLIGVQLLLVLDNVIQFGDEVGGNRELVIHFLWLMIDLLEEDLIISAFFETFSAPFRDTKERHDPVSIHKMVLRLNTLLSARPTTVDRWRFCRLVLFRHFDVSGDASVSRIDLFNLIVKLTASETVLKKSVKDDACEALRNALTFMAGGARVVGSPSGLEIAVVTTTRSLIHSLFGSKVVFRFGSTGPSGLFDKVSIEYNDCTTLPLESLFDNFQKISEVFLREVVLPCYHMDESITGISGDISIADLPSRMLEYCLFLSLKGEISKHRAAGWIRMAALTMIPVLCETCPMEAFLPNPTGSFRLLRLMGLVFGLLNVQGLDNDSMSREVSIMSSFDETEALMKDAPLWFEVESLDLQAPQDLGWSLAQVLLNLLACLLEMGAQKRQEHFEDDLQALVPSLLPLAQTGFSIASADTVDRSEITDAASHILTLIAMRRAPSLTIEEPRVPKTSIHEILREAENDLTSPEAPIRARGMASLRHVVASEEVFLRERAGISIASPVDGQPVDANDHQDGILQLLLKGLGDGDSFVYLASIQTIARVASSSARLFQRIVYAIPSGIIQLNNHDYNLANDQRVKLTEVVTTVFCRSPEARHKASMLLDLLLYGGPLKGEEPKDDKTLSEINKESLLFFETSKNNDCLDTAARWKEKSIKLRTGGPLFLVEEDSLVRASLLNMAANVVSLIEPSIVAKYSLGLIDCCRTLLLLRTSGRPILRAAAHLSVSIYTCVITEAEELLDKGITTASYPMAISMVRGREEDLYHALRQIVEDSESDFAVRARAAEALKLRERAEKGGMFALGYLALENSSRKTEIISNLLNEKQ